jgi:hypothetical protein
LSDRVPRDFFNDALVESGVSIMYPGGRPDLGSQVRVLGADSPAQLINAIRRYRRIADAGRSVPTIAGGVHTGELHAFYELLGPQVAYFLGGAVALHRDGPQAGAELCAEVFRFAREAREREPDGSVRDLPNHLIEGIERMYGSDANNPNYPYLSPVDLIGGGTFLQSWFQGR